MAEIAKGWWQWWHLRLSSAGREFMEFDAENLLQESKSEILRYAVIFAYLVSVRRWNGFALIADLGPRIFVHSKS